MQFGIRELIFLIVIVATPIAAYFVIFKPMDLHTRELQADTMTKTAKLRELEAAQKEQADIGAEIKLMMERIAEFESQLPSESELEVILREVAQIASDKKLHTKTFKPDKPVKTNQYTELPINLVIEGPFPGFYEFVDAVEKLPRITRVPEMKIGKDVKLEDGSVRIEMILSIFYEDKANGSQKVASVR
jgi:type IV pilus assembly protein PilO